MPVESNSNYEIKQEPLQINTDSNKIINRADSNKVSIQEDTTGKTQLSIPSDQSGILAENKDTGQLITNDTNQAVNTDNTQSTVPDTILSVVTNDPTPVV